jgi:hypothetical protein
LAEEANEQARIELALKINRYLHDFRSPTPLVVNQRIAQSVTNLKKSSEELVRASKALDKGAANLSKGSPVLTQLSALKKLIEKKQQ